MARPSIPEATRRQLDEAADIIATLLPSGWSSRVARRSPDGGTLEVRSENDEGELAISVRSRLDPRDVERLDTSELPTVVASRWLSTRTRELLRTKGIGFVDATGNVEIQMPAPGLFIRTTGAQRDPRPKPTAAPNLRGRRAWALLRTLIEVTPPYGLTDLSEALGVDTGYVSRILKVLEGELLIERRPRGPVTSVDWEGVLRQMVSTYSVFDANGTSTWVASGGADQLLRDLAGRRAGQWAVTGSFASAAIVPIAAPEIAFMYTTDPERIAKEGRLLPATSGANVVLAEPYDPVVFQRTRRSDSITVVSIAQIAADDLTGNGRMPEEGEALVAWMRRNLSRWQTPSLRPGDSS